MHWFKGSKMFSTYHIRRNLKLTQRQTPIPHHRLVVPMHAHPVQQSRYNFSLYSHNIVQLLTRPFDNIKKSCTANTALVTSALKNKNAFKIPSRNLYVSFGKMTIHSLQDYVQGLTYVRAALEAKKVKKFVQNFLQHVGSVEKG